MKAVRCHFDESKAGSGRRNFIVISEGPKHTSLLDPATLTHVKVPSRDFAVALVSEHPEKIANRIKRRAKANMKLYKKLGVPFPKKLVKKALSS